jgi:hypothetical protein
VEVRALGIDILSVPYAKAIASGSGVAAGWATAPPTMTWARLLL